MSELVKRLRRGVFLDCFYEHMRPSLFPWQSVLLLPTNYEQNPTTAVVFVPEVRRGKGLLRQNKATNLSLQEPPFGECQSNLLFLCFEREKRSLVSQEGTAARTESVCIHVPK